MFKVGDEVIVKGSVVAISSDENDAYPIAVGFDEGRAEWFEKEEVIPADKTYSQGLADAWELAKKILYGNDKQLIEIFGSYVDPAYFDLTCKREIINNHTPEEALAKIEAYEKEIKVGDVVECDGHKGVVVKVFQGGGVNIVYENGVISVSHPSRKCKKTGKHLEVADLLRQIGE